MTFAGFLVGWGWIGLVLGLEPAAAAEQSSEPPAWVTVVAHRGDHTAAHENSLEAIERAIRAGADYVEVDVRATRDGELVLLHDATLDGTTDGQGRIADLNWAQVERLNLRDPQRPNLQPAKVLRFTQALTALRGRAGLYLDFKDGDRTKVVRALRDFQMVNATVVYDRREALPIWKELEPALRTMTSPEPADLASEALATLKRRLQVDILDGPATAYTPAVIREARRHGLPVWADIQGPWEDPSFWDRILALGADGYQTDRPVDFIRHLQQRGLRERATRVGHADHHTESGGMPASPVTFRTWGRKMVSGAGAVPGRSSSAGATCVESFVKTTISATILLEEVRAAGLHRLDPRGG